MPLVRADLEALLRARKLDRTLTTALPSPEHLKNPKSPEHLVNINEYAVAATGVTALDVRLEGGFPRGQLSEIVGARSSGRASLLLSTLAAATARRELVALIDVLDMLDVTSAEEAGIDLGLLLWIRGSVRGGWALCRDMNQRALDQAIKALTLVLQAGNFGLVAFDAADAPSHAIERLPFTTWLRLQRIIEGSQTACVLVGTTPIARSSAGLTVKLSRAEGRGRAEGKGQRVDGRLFKGLDIEVDVIRARAQRHENAAVPLSTHAFF